MNHGSISETIQQLKEIKVFKENIRQCLSLRLHTFTGENSKTSYLTE